jgi:hypothetical protein
MTQSTSRRLRWNLNQISTGGYIGVATKNVGDKLVALDVLVFPPSMKGAAEGHFAWDSATPPFPPAHRQPAP